MFMYESTESIFKISKGASQNFDFDCFNNKKENIVNTSGAYTYGTVRKFYGWIQNDR